MTKIIDGRKIANDLQQEVKAQVTSLIAQNKQPCLAVVLVGHDPASAVYVSNKVKTCANVGIRSLEIRLPSDVTQSDLLSQVTQLNRREDVHGILVQFPLPKHLSEQVVMQAIHPFKDVDGLHPENVGKLCAGVDCLTPCTPSGIPELITRSGFELTGKHAVVLGRSALVGKPMMNLLVQKGDKANCTVTCCHSGTLDLLHHTRQADILIAAIGVPEFVRHGMVKKGAIVIDVGINRVDDKSANRGYRLVGDVAFDEVAPIASAITPVPGGVGPMTVAMLMKNTLKARQLQQNS